MNPFDLPPLAFVLDAAHRGLLALADLLSPVAGDAAAAAAVILVTLLVRVALIPAGVAQARAEQTRARLAPRLRDLQRRYGKNPERLQRETVQLYRDENTSPFAGCLPLLVQAPVVGVLYAVFLHPMIAGQENALLSETLLGVPLGTGLFGSLTAGTFEPATGIVIGAVILAIAAVGELTRRLFRPAPDAPTLPGVPTALLGTLQFATAGAAAFVPLAAGLYLFVTVTWTLGQRLILRRVYPPAAPATGARPR